MSNVPKNYNTGKKRKGNTRLNFSKQRAFEQEMAKSRKDKGLRFVQGRNCGFYVENTEYFVKNEDSLYDLVKKENKDLHFEPKYCILYVKNTITGQFHTEPYVFRKNDSYTYDAKKKECFFDNIPTVNHKKLKKDIALFGTDKFEFIAHDVGKYENIGDFFIDDIQEYKNCKDLKKLNKNVNFKKDYRFGFNLLKFLTKSRIKNKISKFEIKGLKEDFFDNKIHIENLKNAYYEDIILKIGDSQLKICVTKFAKIPNSVTNFIKNAVLKEIEKEKLVKENLVKKLKESKEQQLKELQKEYDKENFNEDKDVSNNEEKQEVINKLDTGKSHIMVLINRSMGRIHYTHPNKFESIEQYINDHGSTDAKRCLDRGDVFEAHLYKNTDKKLFTYSCYKSKYARTFQPLTIVKGDGEERNVLDRYNDYRDSVLDDYYGSEANLELKDVYAHLDIVYQKIRNYIKGLKENRNYEKCSVPTIENLENFVLSKISEEELRKTYMAERFHNIIKYQKVFLKNALFFNTIEDFTKRDIRISSSDNRRKLMTEAEGVMTNQVIFPRYASLNKKFSLGYRQPIAGSKKRAKEIDKMITRVEKIERQRKKARKSIEKYAKNSMHNISHSFKISDLQENNKFSSTVECRGSYGHSTIFGDLGIVESCCEGLTHAVFSYSTSQMDSGKIQLVNFTSGGSAIAMLEKLQVHVSHNQNTKK